MTEVTIYLIIGTIIAQLVFHNYEEYVNGLIEEIIKEHYKKTQRRLNKNLVSGCTFICLILSWPFPIITFIYSLIMKD